jgi:hypothetical protein
VVSVKPSEMTTPHSRPHGPVRVDEFSMVGVHDVHWLLQPRFQRLLDNTVASPGAFRTVRFFGALSSDTLENNVDVDPRPRQGRRLAERLCADGVSGTFRALGTLTTRGSAST